MYSLIGFIHLEMFYSILFYSISILIFYLFYYFLPENSLHYTAYEFQKDVIMFNINSINLWQFHYDLIIQYEFTVGCPFINCFKL